jgi:hexosaminidase
MTYPRSWAIAEAVWSQAANKNWPDFVRRTDNHFTRAEAAGILVSKALYDPMATTSVKGNDTLLQIKCEHPEAIIHYTLDGTHPDGFSPVFTNPVNLPDGPVVLRTTTYRNGLPLGRVLVLSREELMKRK